MRNNKSQTVIIVGEEITDPDIKAIYLISEEEAKNIIAAQSHYKRWENIVDEFHGTDDYSEYLEKAAKLCIASLSEQVGLLSNKNNELREALKGIMNSCDPENPSHENIWRIAYGVSGPMP